MEMNMTSIDSAQYRSIETAPRSYDLHTYDAGIPAHHGAWFSGLDMVAYSLAAFMALAPLAMAAYGALVVGA
jgi:hypothetical protein